jgi:hypothetical protein
MQLMAVVGVRMAEQGLGRVLADKDGNGRE